MGKYENNPVLSYGNGYVKIKRSYISQTYKRVLTCVDIRADGISETHSCAESFSGPSKPSACLVSAFSSDDFEDSSKIRYKLCFNESAFTEYSMYELDEFQSSYVEADVYSNGQISQNPLEY